jgi:hypothetical protein
MLIALFSKVCLYACKYKKQNLTGSNFLQNVSNCVFCTFLAIRLNIWVLVHELDCWLHMAKLHLLPSLFCFAVREFSTYPFAVVVYLPMVLPAITLEFVCCTGQGETQLGWLQSTRLPALQGKG